MKPLRCAVRLHAWERCRCSRCGAVDEGRHAWQDGCTCAGCGATRDVHHTLAGCRCEQCGAVVHAFEPAGSEQHICRICAVREPHRICLERRWEDWGGWDSIGGWTAQENEYRVCARCGWEDFVRFTGNIQV